MKRQYRNDMSQSQKDKLSYINQGKKLAPSTRAKISQSMTKYWNGLPYKPGTAPEESSSGSTLYYGEN